MGSEWQDLLTCEYSSFVRASSALHAIRKNNHRCSNRSIIVKSNFSGALSNRTLFSATQTSVGDILLMGIPFG